MNFDDKAKQTIHNLSELFNKKIQVQSPIISPYSVGIEIEIKFKYFFPEISDKYFIGRKYWTFSTEERTEVTELITKQEEHLQKILEQTIDAGIPKGTDRYWEFAFTPVYDLSLIISQIHLLRSTGLIPKGTHSLHINIGGLKASPDIYYILMIMELLYVTKERIQEGFPTDLHPHATWSKKGSGGVMIKNENDFIDTSVGFEYRSLCISDDTNVKEMFLLLSYFLKSIHNGEKNYIIQTVKDKMLWFGLPDKNWRKPEQEPDIWNGYINCFNEFSLFVKNLIKK